MFYRILFFDTVNLLSVYTYFACHTLPPYLLINLNTKAVINMGLMQLKANSSYEFSPYSSINPTFKAGINVVFMQFKPYLKGEL